jgi:hypothetical protein
MAIKGGKTMTFSHRPTLRVLFVAASLAMSAGPAVSAVEGNSSDAPTVAKADAEANYAACGEGGMLNGTTEQAKHSAEATAHKTIIDPNNQLGTSLQGRTRGPVTCVATASNSTPGEEILE